MSSRRPAPRQTNADALNLRTRRTAVGIVLALGLAILAAATLCAPTLRSACLLLGSVLAVPALICLGADLLLQRAVNTVQVPQRKKD